MSQMSTHGLAQTLETLSQVLRELPDQGLHTLLQQLRAIREKRRRSRESRLIRDLPPPPRDPRLMGRRELEAYLQSPQYFPHKADLLEFARRYKVPIDARTPREEMIRLCLRIIHDIPKGLANLRFLAERYDSPPQARRRPSDPGVRGFINDQLGERGEEVGKNAGRWLSDEVGRWTFKCSVK